MSIETILLLALIGLTAGILGGMIGLGGGIILIPAMVMLLKMDQQTAQGTSIAVMLPPIGLFAVFNYYKAGYVNIKYAIIIAIAFMIGGYFGSGLALKLSPALMRRIFSVLLILIAIRMFFSGKSA
ncbi:MAG: sulfite exporter TauE/SafE family protein [Bacteroidetes bacterium]|nr:sulfite exporter TauE/SafE family protein [Bacteroidota bacterium]